MNKKIIAGIIVIVLLLLGLWYAGVFNNPWYEEEIPPDANVAGDWNVKLSFEDENGNWIDIPKNNPLTFFYGDVQITKIKYTVSAAITGEGYTSALMTPVGSTVQVIWDWYWKTGANPYVFQGTGYTSCLAMVSGSEVAFNGNTVTVPINTGSPQQIFYAVQNLATNPIVSAKDGSWYAQIYLPDTGTLPQISYTSTPVGISGTVTVPKIVLFLYFTKKADTLTFSWSAGTGTI